MGMGNSQPEQKTKGTQRTKGRSSQLQSLKSLSSLKDGQPTPDTFIPPHGGYQQLKRQEQDFLKEGGLRERMTRARLAVRAKQGAWP